MQRIASNIHHNGRMHHAHPVGSGTAALHCIALHCLALPTSRLLHPLVRSHRPVGTPDSLRVRTYAQVCAPDARGGARVHRHAGPSCCCGRRPHPFVCLFVFLLALAVSRFACVSAWPCDGTAGATLLGAAPRRAAPAGVGEEGVGARPDCESRGQPRIPEAPAGFAQSQYVRCSLYSPVRRAGARSKRCDGLRHDRRQCEGLGGAGPVP